MAWAFAFGKPIMTFRELDKSEIKMKNKRTRSPGEIVKDVKKIVTAKEIGKATVVNVNTLECDEAAKAISRDIGERDNQKGR